MKNKYVYFLVLFLSFGQLRSDTTEVVLKIENVKIDNAWVNWGKAKLIGDVTYDKLDSFGIPQNAKINNPMSLITFKFGFSDGSSGNYRYKLLGLDREWSIPSIKNEVSYFNLSPLQYNFIVQQYEDGLIKQEAKFNFEISKPANERTDINLIALFLYTLIFIIIYSLSTAQIRRNKKKLEKTVIERTKEIIEQKDEISLQKLIVEEKHKEISDSINYAKRIQSALLTSHEYWDSISAENFVIWRPKDVVSGDFHWAYQLTIGSKHLHTSEEVAVWCAADCTGHGVPGAFMSMLGISFLNEIVIENVNLKPADILNKLRNKIISALEHGGTGNIEQKDGMDIALCVWHKASNILEYAGANNPVWIIRVINDSKAHEIIELKANRMPVGYHYDTKEFTGQKIQLLKGDAIYVFTDGFVDQFGGQDGKKYKSKKFKEMLLSIQHLNMQDQALMINKEFNDWRGDNEQIDDLCLVGIKVV